jgi:integrase/recombinase XerD
MSSLTNSERFLTWMTIEQGRSPRTIEAYRRDLVRYQNFLFEHSLDELSVNSQGVEKFIASLRAEGKASKSVARMYAAVRMLHRFLVEERIRIDNPTSGVDGVKVPSGIPKALSEDQVSRLLASVTGVDSFALRDRALLEFLYATGARISEACGLSLSDLDMESQLVRLFGKGSKERIVPFGSHAKSALADWLGAGGRPMLVPDQWVKRDHADAVFLGSRGTRLSRQAAWGIVRKYAQIAGIGDEISPHVMRHSCATHMLIHGADLRIVQELLGHASVSTTQVYTRVDNEVLFTMYREAHPRARIGFAK